MSIVPLALAREIIPAGDSPIYVIAIWDIDYPPIAGDHRAVSTAANVHFSCYALVWNHRDENRIMDDDDIFEVVGHYSFGMKLLANSGCILFADNANITLNGGELTVDADYSGIDKETPCFSTYMQ